MFSKIFGNAFLWLGIILVVAFIVRLYEIDNAVADWHAWRQADTAAVARSFYEKGYNPFYPQGVDMSMTSASGKVNWQAYRFVEFPIYNTLVYWGYLLNGKVEAQVARLVSVMISMGSLVLVYFLTKRYFGKVTGLMASLLFGILPYSIFYSRVVLPEPILVFFCLGMVYFTDRWIFENRKWLYFVSMLFIAGAFLTKPMAVFYLLPLIISYFRHEKRIFPIPLRYFALFVPALAPFLGWRWWMSQFPEGIPASSWLLNGDFIRFKPSFWRVLLHERLGREILTVAGTVLLFVGLLIKPNPKEGYFLHTLALGSFLFLAVFATGNVRHDYYQALIVPALVIFVARGVVVLFRGIPNILPRLITIPIAVLFFVLTIGLGWYDVRGLYQINNDSVVEGGEMADRLLPKEAIVAAPYFGGDTVLLYHVNRLGFPLMIGSVEQMRTDYGITHYVSVFHDSETQQIMSRHKVLADHPKYVIVELKPSPEKSP